MAMVEGGISVKSEAGQVTVSGVMDMLWCGLDRIICVVR